MKPNIDDSLRAVQIHFPHYRNVSNATFHLKVYLGELSQDPVYERLFVEPFYPDTVFDTLQGFTTYRLVDANGNLTPIAIPAGKFYISLEQSSNINQTVYVGVDKNTPDAMAYQYYFDGLAWFPAASLSGALMIRPRCRFDYTDRNIHSGARTRDVNYSGVPQSGERLFVFRNRRSAGI